MTWSLAEVGRPGPARDVLDGGDVDPTTGRLLSVGELQAALRAARAASTRQPSTDQDSVAKQRADATPARSSAACAPAACAPAPAPAPVPAPASGPGTRTGAPSAGPGVLRPPAGRRWVAVVGAHHGAGASTVALALADAAATGGWPVHLVSCNAPTECGLVGAATVELGTDPAGAWRTGRRGAGVTVARPAPGRDLSTWDPADPGRGSAWPPVPPGVNDRDLLTVVDAEAGAARAPQQLATAAAVLLVCRVSVPGVQQAEQLLGRLLGPTRTDATQDDPAPVVLVAALAGDGWWGRWPRAVRHACGPLLGQLQSEGRVVTVPLDRQLATYRPTGSALPRAVTRSAALAVRLLEGTGALRRPRSTDPDLHAGTARPAPGASRAGLPARRQGHQLMMNTADMLLAAGVCPVAPPGLQIYADQILGWVKWGVLAILAISFFASVGMLIWGRVTHHPKGARLGFDGIMICLVGAIIYVVGYVILTSITGNGC